MSLSSCCQAVSCYKATTNCWTSFSKWVITTTTLESSASAIVTWTKSLKQQWLSKPGRQWSDSGWKFIRMNFKGFQLMPFRSKPLKLFSICLAATLATRPGLLSVYWWCGWCWALRRWAPRASLSCSWCHWLAWCRDPPIVPPWWGES